jgi:hypothetical protein
MISISLGTIRMELVLWGRLVHLIVAWELFGFLSTLWLTQQDPTSVGYQEKLAKLADWKRCIEHIVRRLGNHVWSIDHVKGKFI